MIEEEQNLRDAFATSALIGLLATVASNNPWFDEDDITGSYSRRAYEYADAMIEARKTNNNKE